MSRRSVTRAVFAPVVVAAATIILSPDIFNSSNMNAALTRIDRWMTSVSLTVIAVLPGAPGGERTPTPIVDTPAIAEIPPLPTGDETVVLAATAPAKPLAEPEIKEAPVATPPEKLASLNPVETSVERAPEVVVAAPPTEAKVIPDAQPVLKPEPVIEAKAQEAPIERAPEVVAAPPTEAEVIPDAQPALKPEPVIEITVIADTGPAETTAAIAEPKPAPDVEWTAVADAKPAPAVATEVAREAAPPALLPEKEPAPKPEERQVVASLGPTSSVLDMQPVPSALPALEAKAAPALQPLLDEPASPSSDHRATDPLQMTNVPMSSPLKIRALTRADIPSADKVASLEPRNAGTKNQPPELQRVAYDAPVVTEEPTSIGRRRWHEEAAKYQGLGSPEALLEALRHLGAGAKTLGLPASLWCADFMNLVLRKSGLNATGSRAAKSYLQYGKQIDGPRVGAIAIFTRGGNGGHVGIVRGTDGNGNPIIVSGNYNHRVAEAVYPKARVIAYVVPR